MDKYTGNDNYGKPKSEYLIKLSEMDEKALKEECKSKIWLSAYANNNPRSDYHWHVDACYDECAKRTKPEIYKSAYEETYKSIRG
jgi:hypothetical protein